jgi:hypothetical protein
MFIAEKGNFVFMKKWSASFFFLSLILGLFISLGLPFNKNLAQELFYSFVAFGLVSFFSRIGSHSEV